MPTHKPVKIKDILIQGCGGQRIHRLKSSIQCGLLKTTDRPSEQEIKTFTVSHYILTDSEFLYYDIQSKQLTALNLSNEVRNTIQSWLDMKKRNSYDDGDFSRIRRLMAEHLNELQKITGHVASAIDPMTMSKEDLDHYYGYGYSIVHHNDLYYQVNPNASPPVFLIEDNATNKTYRDKLVQHFTTDNPISHLDLSAIAPTQSTPSTEQKPDRMLEVYDLIEAIAAHAQQHQNDPGTITRTMTDEFTFYPRDKPFTLEEYKAIINKTAEIANQLPPNVHLMLATFPVIWEDGGVHNCGLYVQSPCGSHPTSLVHHFSKKYPSHVDFLYRKPDGTLYNLTSDSDHASHSPNKVLEHTKAAINDPNQYESSLNITLDDGASFIASIGVCLDHSKGVERDDVHHLIDQLQKKQLVVPLLCNHVITSSTISRHNEHILSTVSHADPFAENRRPENNTVPGRSGFEDSTINSVFSGTLSAEIYPAKYIGTMHSDLFLHAVSNQSDALASRLNERDESGSTMLHQVFLESPFDRELIAKRLFSMVIAGGDPYVKNAHQQSALDLANELDAAMPNKKIVSTAISNALEWREPYAMENQISEDDGKTTLTRNVHKTLQHGNKNMDAIFMRAAVLNGANPYQRDDSGKSALDIIDEHESSEVRDNAKNAIHQALVTTQYGYVRRGIESQSSAFYPYIPHNLNALQTNASNSGMIKKIDAAIRLYPTNLTKDEVEQITFETILDAFSDFKAMVTLPSIDAKLLYDAIRFRLSKDNIILPEMNESLTKENPLLSLSQAMITVFFDQWKNSLVNLIPNANELLLLLSFLSEHGRSALFHLVKNKLYGMIQVPTDYYFIQYLSPAERSEVFELTQDKLPDIIKHPNDIQFIQYLSPEEQQKRFDLVKDKLGDLLDNSDDLLFIKHLPLTLRKEGFALIKDKVRDLIKCSDDLSFVKYLPVQERSEIFTLLKDDLAGLLSDDFSSNFITYFLPEESIQILESISNESWENIQQTFDSDISYASDLITNTSNHPLAFFIIFKKLQCGFLNHVKNDHRAKTLRALSQCSPDFLNAIKEVFPKIIQAYSINGLKVSQEIKTLIAKLYPPDEYEKFQLFITSLDKEHSDTILQKIDISSMFNRSITASVKFKNNYQNLIHSNIQEEGSDLVMKKP